MIIPRAVALLGLGFQPITFATLGLIVPDEAPSQPAVTAPVLWPRHFPPPGSAAGGGGTGAGPMWITFDDEPAPRPKPILIQPDGTEIYDRSQGRWSDRTIENLLAGFRDGFRAIVPYRAVPLATAEPDGRQQAATSAAASALAGLLSLIRMAAAAQTEAYRALASAVAALARKEAELNESVARLRREQNALRDQQAAIAAALAAPIDTGIREWTAPDMLAGYTDLAPLATASTELVPTARPPLWRVLFAGALLLGAVALAATTFFYVTHRRSSTTARSLQTVPQRRRRRTSTTPRP